MKESVTILKEALLTEKATPFIKPESIHIFGRSKSNERNIKDAVEAAFGVTVLNVNTSILKPKSKRDRMRRNKLVTLLM